MKKNHMKTMKDKKKMQILLNIEKEKKNTKSSWQRGINRKCGVIPNSVSTLRLLKRKWLVSLGHLKNTEIYPQKKERNS